MEQWQLRGDLAGLEARVQRLAEAVAGCVEAISGRHGIRLDVLLVHTGLNGWVPVSGREAVETLGVSYQRVQQISAQLHRNHDQARFPGGIWMPQIDAAMRDGWSDGYTVKGVGAIRLFFGR